jgi:L-fuconolactonase
VAGQHVIDTHVHLVSADSARYPRSADPPIRTASYTWTAEQFLGAMTEAGVTRATVVQPFGVYGLDNTYQADVAARYPARFAGVCGVTPDAVGAEALRFWVTERGMSGARVIMLGRRDALSEDGLDIVLAAAAQLGIPVCVLASRRQLSGVAASARRFDSVPIIVDHLGWLGDLPLVAGEAAAAVEPLAPLANVFLKVTTKLVASGPESRRLLESLIITFGPARMVWGSNFPVTDYGGYAATVSASREALAFLGDAERNAIVSGTAEAVWPALTMKAS